MKLHEIKLFEEPIETKSAEDVWTENESSAASYITTTVYFIRQLDPKVDKYEVTYDDAGKRKTYATMDKADLDASFTPVRPNQQPDAEGFTAYRSAEAFDAFKYNSDPLKVTLDGDSVGQTVKLNKGDYLLRQDNGNDFTYSVERANFFDNKYARKK